MSILDAKKIKSFSALKKHILFKLWLVLVYTIFIESLVLSVWYLDYKSMLVISDQQVKDTITVGKVKLKQGGFVVVKYIPKSIDHSFFSPEEIIATSDYLYAGTYHDLRLRIIRNKQDDILKLKQGYSFYIYIYKDSDNNSIFARDIDSPQNDLFGKAVMIKFKSI